MKNSNELYLLINSLTKAEKRKFKLTQGSGSIQSTLFDFIEQRQDVNDGVLKENFKDETFTRQLTATKYALFHNVLDALCELYNDKGTENEINWLLRKTAVLFERKLISAAYFLNQKAKNLAAENENFLQLQKVLNWEQRLLLFLPPDEALSDKIIDCGKERESNLLKISNLEKIRNKRHFAYLYITINKNELTRLRLPRPITLLNELEGIKPLSVKAEAELYFSQGTLNFSEGRFKEAFKAYSKALKVLEEYPFLKEEKSNYSYLGYFQNTMACIMNGDFKEEKLPEMFAKAYQEIGENTMEQLAIFRLELAYLIKQRQFSTALEVIEGRSELVEKMGMLVHFMLSDLLYGLVITYFWNQQLNKAIKLINQVLVFENYSVSNEVKIALRFIEYLIHQELGNFELAQKKAKELEEDINVTDSEFKDSLFILKGINAYYAANSRNKQIHVLREYFDKEVLDSGYKMSHYLDLDFYLKKFR